MVECLLCGQGSNEDLSGAVSLLCAAHLLYKWGTNGIDGPIDGAKSMRERIQNTQLTTHMHLDWCFTNEGRWGCRPDNRRLPAHARPWV